MFHPEGPSFRELCRQALSSTERGYDLLAPKFDFTPFRTPDELIMATLSHAPRPIGSALDLCCGTGAAIRWLRPLCHERIVGIDFSRGMLAEARLKSEQQPRSKAVVEWVHGDVLELPFEEEFDVVTCFGSLGHFRRQDETSLLRGVHRALKPGGCFLFATAERPPLHSANRWLAIGFNTVMRLRNALIEPAFVMYYLSFTLPDVLDLLSSHGFEPTLHEAGLAPPLGKLRIVIATKKN